VSTVDTSGVDVTDLSWRESLWYSGIREPHTVVGEVDPATGAATERWSGDETCGQFYPAATPLPGHRFLAVRQGYRRPPELAVFAADGPRTVLSFEHTGTRALRALAGTMEHVTWTAPDGLAIGGFLCRPDSPGPHPLVLHVHGGPVLAFRNRWQLGYPLVPLLVEHGYAVLSANPRGSTGRGRSFVDAVVGDMGGADADDLLSGVDAMISRGVTEPGRLGVTGHSYGGFMSCLLVGRTDRFAAAVAMSSVTDWYTQHYASDIGWFDDAFLADTPGARAGRHLTRSPVAYADRVRTPTLLIAGERDGSVPPVQSAQFHTALADRGVPTQLAVYPEEGHVLRGQRAVLDAHARLLDWFTRWLPA
jgi:dipeptidyl aminopeptidase/acylaminoacyl peptidase